MKIRIELRTEDAEYFLEKSYTKCYYLLDTCLIYARIGFLPMIKDIIRQNSISCKLEYTYKKNVFLEVYNEGRLLESNSLTHIYNREHIKEYLLDQYDSAFNVGRLLMVTATRDEDEEDFPF